MSRHGHANRRPSTPCSILCVDDDPFLGELLLFALQRDGYRAELATTTGDALEAIAAERPDLVLLDIQLPDGDGLAVCGFIQATHRTPVILMSGRPSDEEAIAGFAHGADDYVAKPFNMHLLLYRIRAVLRRAGALEPFDLHSLRLGAGAFSAGQHEVRGPCGRVKLTPIESDILQLLLAHEGQAFSAAGIMERVWAVEGKGSAMGVKTHIRRLRQKLAGALGDPELIQTLPGLGYVLRQGPSLIEIGRFAGHDGGAGPARRPVVGSGA